MPALLRPAPVPIARLAYRQEDRMFSADCSDLGIRGFGRVYNDSVDEGMTIVGATGREVVLVVSHVEYDRRENELRWWDLVPANPADRAVINGARIWND